MSSKHTVLFFKCLFERGFRHKSHYTEEQDLQPIMEPTTRGQSRCYRFTLVELCCLQDSNIISMFLYIITFLNRSTTKSPVIIKILIFFFTAYGTELIFLFSHHSLLDHCSSFLAYCHLPRQYAPPSVSGHVQSHSGE